MTIDFNDFQGYRGFSWVIEDKVEIMFITPDFMGIGLDKSLLKFAIETLKISKVDVNEQNTSSVTY